MSKSAQRRQKGANAPKRAPGRDGWEALMRSRWTAPVFFACLCVVYFSGFLFTDRVMLGLDTGSEYHTGKEPFTEKLADLEPEDWSRYLGGTPQSGFRQPKYFPLHAIYLFTSHHRYLGWRYVFSVFFAGCFAYLFARGLGVGKPAAIVAGTAYASAPTLLTFIYPGQEAKMLVIGLLPLMAWGIYRILDTCRWRYALPVAAGVASGIYTPHLQMLYYALIGLAVLGAVRLIQLTLQERDWRRCVVRLTVATAAVVLGLAIGSMGFVPQYWYTKTQSSRAGESGEGVGLDYAQSWPLHPEEIASLVLPQFVHFDTAEARNYWGRNPFKLNAEYFGLITLVLAAMALSRLRQDRRTVPFLVLFLFGLAFSLGPHTPIHALFYHYVPGMRLLRVPGMIAFLMAFAACGLAALELDRLLAPGVGPQRGVRRLAVGVACLSVPLLLAAASPATALKAWAGLLWPDIPAEKLRAAQANLTHVAQGSLVILLLAWAFVLLVWRRSRGALSATGLGALILLLILIDTWRIDKQFLVYVDPDRYPSPEQAYPDVIRFFDQDTDLYRVYAAARLQPAIPDIDLVTVPYHEPFTVRRYDRITQPENMSLATLSLLNARYIITREPLELPGVSLALSANGLMVYRNASALPWFYTAVDDVVQTDEDLILQRLKAGRVDPSRTVILETPVRELTPSTAGTPESDSIRKQTYDPKRGRIELEVDVAGPRVLVVSENYDPYWRAFVDGVETAVLRANYVWKGIRLPAGRHRVEFRYRDPVAVFCRWLSLLATLLWLGSAGWLAWRHRAIGASV